MSNNLINKYINKVTKNMGSKQREEVSRELNAHILDSADALAEERNVDVDDTIIQEIISRMGPAEELAAMYPEEKADSDNIGRVLKYMVKFTIYFIVVAAIIGIVLQLLFGNISLYIFLLVSFTVYVVTLLLKLLREILFPNLFEK
jgi:hypothetical protein